MKTAGIELSGLKPSVFGTKTGVSSPAPFLRPLGSDVFSTGRRLPQQATAGIRFGTASEGQFPRVIGEGPLPTQDIQQIVLRLARPHGVPNELLPLISWNPNMKVAGQYSTNGHTIQLNPAKPLTGVFQALQHEFFHSVVQLKIASLPAEKATPAVQRAFTEALEAGQFHSLILRDQNGDRSGFLDAPSMSREDWKAFAQLFNRLVIQQARIEGNLLQVPYSEADRVEASRFFIERPQTPVNQWVQYWYRLEAEYGSHLYQHTLSKNINRLRSLLAQHPFPRPIGEDEATDAMKMNMIATTQNDRVYYHLTVPITDPNMPSLTSYYFCPEEVGAKVNEEHLFIRLHDDISASGPQTADGEEALAILAHARDDAQARIRTMRDGEREMTENGQHSDFPKLLQAFRQTSVDDSKMPTRFDMALFANVSAPVRAQMQASLKQRLAHGPEEPEKTRLQQLTKVFQLIEQQK